ncbi:hypothetical protein CesoFtcFv8_016297 [Champsocephalus esox]|uniref:Uncharacterized protein n=1 Tax=Champsocephalus esox TaxID=159716 RepID=A0AAN8BN05_9TELE|nr:hypothetical protein CesoFtcFv8_016297 [Champsocephalus esox]
MERSDSLEDEFSSCALSVTLQALRQVLLGFKAAKAELAAENAALKEQRASWELEKNMLLDEKEHLVSTLFLARRYIHSVKESLRLHKTETEKATKAWKEQHHQLNEMKPSFDKAVMELKKERESRRLVTENEEAASLEKEEAITSDRKGVMALEEEHLEETRQRETEWQTQHKVLEGQIECELATKEILKTSEQKQSREVEEKWLNKEEEWLNKEREMRDEMQLLNQRNAQLQELAAKTDKEKARMKKEEEKAKKEAEKRMKEREEREEKERKDRLKKEEKENEERKKREKTERKKRGYRFLNAITPFTLSPLLQPSPMPASLPLTEMS